MSQEHSRLRALSSADSGNRDEGKLYHAEMPNAHISLNFPEGFNDQNVTQHVTNLFVKHRQRYHNDLTPKTGAISNDALVASYEKEITFELDPDTHRKLLLRELALVINISNTSGSDFGMNFGNFIKDARWEYNNNDIECISRPEAITFRRFDAEGDANWNVLQNRDASDLTAATNLATANTETYFAHLPFHILEDNPEHALYIGGFRSISFLRITVSGKYLSTGVATITSIALREVIERMDNQDVLYHANLYKETHLWRFFHVTQNDYPITLIAAQNNEQLLNNTRGLIKNIDFLVRPSPYTTNETTFLNAVTMQSISLEDETGCNIIRSEIDKWNRHHTQGNDDSSLARNVNIYTLKHGYDDDFKDNPHLEGYYFYNGTEKLQLNPGALSGAHIITTMEYRAYVLKVQNHDMVAIRS